MKATRRLPPLRFVAAVVALQAAAAIYFLVDGVNDVLHAGSDMTTLEASLEALVALGLLAGVVLGVFAIRAAAREARETERALDLARGALAEAIDLEFARWGLTASEADVALFALKGCTVEQIATMRASAQGTVRAQLSQVYAKAGVNSQAALMATIMEDLLPRRDSQ